MTENEQWIAQTADAVIKLVDPFVHGWQTASGCTFWARGGVGILIKGDRLIPRSYRRGIKEQIERYALDCEVAVTAKTITIIPALADSFFANAIEGEYEIVR